MVKRRAVGQPAAEQLDNGRRAKSRTIGTAEVARALGVSVSTVKRWIDDGTLPAERSRGGHRRLYGEEVVRAVRNHRLPSADLTLLLDLAGSSRGLPRRQFLHALKTGDQQRVAQLVNDVRRNGTTMSSLGDDLIAPVMHAIGHQCATGSMDISEEHRATHLCLGALYQVKAVVLERATMAGAPMAIGGAPEDDPYVLGSLLAELVLLDNHWNVVNLGADTPMMALSTAVRRWRPALVWLSISHLPDDKRFIHEFSEFCHAVQLQNPAIILGGRALSRGLQEALPCSAVGAKMRHLSQFARSLVRRDP